MRILVVDDSPINLRHASDLLSRWGIVPTTACNGVEALAVANERHFDIILMDISMPVMDGLQATQQLRRQELAHPDRPRTSIVAHSTGWLLTDMELLAQVGFDDAIHKPCSTDQLQACFQRLGLPDPASPLTTETPLIQACRITRPQAAEL